MSRWFRVYDDMVDDPKVQRLGPDLFKALVNLWCLASKNDGKLPALDEIAFKLRMRPERLAKMLAELKACGLLDKDEWDNHIPHNWDKRQYKSDVSNERVQRHRERQRNVSCNVTVTPPETEADTESEQKESSLRSLDDWPNDFKDKFWALYPAKKGKQAALRELERVRRKSVSFEKLMESVRTYAATADPQFTKHPKTWLSQGCWDDEPDQRSSNVVQGSSRGNVIEAADRLVAKLRGLDRTSEDVRAGIRSGAGADHVRLLPQGGRERPGDVHAGDHSDPHGIQGGNRDARHGPEDGTASEVELPSDCG